MKNRRRKFAAAVAMIAATAAAVHVLNRYIEKSAVSGNLLSRKAHHTFPWRLGNVSYTRSGSGDPVLLIHELTPCSNSYEWHRIVDALSEKYTVYCLDLPGCGLSERQKITYTNFYYVQLITDFIESVIGGPACVLATGLSASLAVTSCNYAPKLFRKILLINPVSLHALAQIPTRRSKAAKLLLELPLAGTLLYHLIVSRLHVEKEFTERLFADPFRVKSEYVDVYHESSHRDGSSGKYLFSSIIGNYVYFNISHALKSIDNDIVILGGEQQEHIQETIQDYRRINPAIEASIIPDTRHLPQLEKPAEFLELLKIYL
jgi:pimeloyl-ACP methyl ester carboxylesterase